MKFERITLNPVATGKPCTRNLRFPVSRLLRLLAAGKTRETILKAYPYLEAADIDEALRYAASLAEDAVEVMALSPDLASCVLMATMRYTRVNCRWIALPTRRFSPQQWISLRF